MSVFSSFFSRDPAKDLPLDSGDLIAGKSDICCWSIFNGKTKVNTVILLSIQ